MNLKPVKSSGQKLAAVFVGLLMVLLSGCADKNADGISNSSSIDSNSLSDLGFYDKYVYEGEHLAELDETDEINAEAEDVLLNTPLDTTEPVYADVSGDHVIEGIDDYELLQLDGSKMPSGCEITSLTMVLNYLGYDVTKEQLADRYLATDELVSSSPWDCFVGSPYSDGYGCYVPVLENTAKAYLSDIGSDLKTKANYNFRPGYQNTGLSAESLYRYIDMDIPVIVWATIDMEFPLYGAKWLNSATGLYFRWIYHEHCLVLVGYSEDSVTVLDPLEGLVEYDRETFEYRFMQMHRQSLILY